MDQPVERRKRGGCFLHLSTALVMTFVAAVLLYLNISSAIILESSNGDGTRDIHTRSPGWPYAAFEYKKQRAKGEKWTAVQVYESFQSLKLGDDSQFSTEYPWLSWLPAWVVPIIIFDLPICLGIVACVVIVWEVIIRRSKKASALRNS